MNDKQIKLIIGSILHDIGKIVYRSGDGRNHSLSGYEFLKECKNDFDKEILDCVRYHHGINLKNADISADSIAYITYFADNVAAAADRRENGSGEDGFDKSMPLSSIFNILNGNNDSKHYSRQVLDPAGEINYPTDDSAVMDKAFYDGVIRNIKNNLMGIEVSHDYINSLLSLMEANLSYIPSSTSKRELSDISLYDHVKITTAVSECIYHYFRDKNINNYKEYLFGSKTEDTWSRKMMLLYSIDISGIQSFIYTISSKGALRGLRARSFYLEMIMEHIIDELLDKLELSRACLLYAGGGHCYILAPNIEAVRTKLLENKIETNEWFMKHFGTDLYMADGYTECSAAQLKNEPEGSYRELYKDISRAISLNKSHRYTADDIRVLNSSGRTGDRECSICRRADKLDEHNHCMICAALEKLSASILYKGYFAIMLSRYPDSLPLPGNKYLVAGDDNKLRSLMERDDYVRSYTKNQLCTGKHVTTKLWVGDYNVKGETFGDLAEKSEGIRRIAVLRADVDNLGNAFVNGFRQQGGKYETISRTSALSRQLSLFFKCYINKILRDGDSQIFTKSRERQVNIVYSGGDDVFIAGAWNDVVDAFTDIRNAFIKFTQGTLTLSGGIGIFDSSHPINRMAAETAELEEISKHVDGKDAITLSDASGSYRWDVYLKAVLDEKYRTISRYLANTDDRGKAFLYKLLELLRITEGARFNRAKFVYYLSRLEPSQRDDKAGFDAYRSFSSNMYQWSMNAEDRRQTVTAIYLYVYLTREREGKNTYANQ